MGPDAYEEFLDLLPGPRPPHHYALLAIPLFESDPKIIHDAGLSQNAKVRRWALHPDREKSDAVQDLLNKLGRATFDLEDPQRKAEYDRKLAADLGVPLPRPPDPVQPPAPPRPAPPPAPRGAAIGPPPPPQRPAAPAPPRSAAVIPGPRPAPRPAPAAQRCPACDAPIRPGAAFCSACGEELGAEEEPLSLAERARRRRQARTLTRVALLAAAAFGALLLYLAFRGGETQSPPVQPGPTVGQLPPGPPPPGPQPPGPPPPPPEVKVYKAGPFDAAEAKRRQEETARALGAKVEEDVDLGGGVKLTLVLIPAGEFMMGSPPGEKERSNDEDLHRVTIATPFWMGKYEVTQEQWERVIGTNPSGLKGAKNPAECLDWNDIRRFLQVLNDRKGGGGFALPTEAQWEYACRAGTNTRFFSGNDEAELDAYAWYDRNSQGRTHPVGEKACNAWGLYDMHGNAMEWCGSAYAEKYDGDEEKITEAGGRGRPFRGGGCYGNLNFCRSASRRWSNAVSGAGGLDWGFRVVRLVGPVPRVVERPAPDLAAPLIARIEKAVAAKDYPSAKAALEELKKAVPANARLPELEGQVAALAPPPGWPFDAAEAKRRQEQAALVLAVSAEKEVDIGGAIKLALVLIPAGSFSMGSDKGENGEKPVHTVTIAKPFYMGKTEVTQEQWEAVVGNNPCRVRAPWNPVVNVSWEDCQGFLKKLSDRTGQRFALPSEAEWEYACRAGCAASFFFGENESELSDYAWYSKNGGGHTHPVGQKRPNAWGLYDMLGNVWEWCQDVYHYGYSGAPADGSPRLGGGGEFVLRGGSVSYAFPTYIRSASRCNHLGGVREDSVGLRVVCRPEPPGGNSSTPAPVVERPKAEEKAPADLAGPIVARVEKAVAAKDYPSAKAALDGLKKADPTHARLAELDGRVAAIAPKAAQAFQVYKDWPFDAAEAKRRQEGTAQALGVKVEDDVDVGRGVTLTLVLIPAGEFMMGSPPSEKAKPGKENLHRVTIGEPFWMGKYEATQKQWEGVMGNNLSRFQGAGNPVEAVSWDEIQRFLQKLNGRLKGGGFALPTEAQWEYACRAGRSTRFSSGDDDSGLGGYAWYLGNSQGTTHPVGQKTPNAWGLYDMHGNVWEWCASPYADRYDGSEEKGAEADGRLRVLRGGSWSLNPSFCRAAVRVRNEPGRRLVIYGFRVVRSARTF